MVCVEAFLFRNLFNKTFFFVGKIRRKTSRKKKKHEGEKQCCLEFMNYIVIDLANIKLSFLTQDLTFPWITSFLIGQI